MAGTARPMTGDRSGRCPGGGASLKYSALAIEDTARRDKGTELSQETGVRPGALGEAHAPRRRRAQGSEGGRDRQQRARLEPGGGLGPWPSLCEFAGEGTARGRVWCLGRWQNDCSSGPEVARVALSRGDRAAVPWPQRAWGADAHMPSRLAPPPGRALGEGMATGTWSPVRKTEHSRRHRLKVVKQVRM